MPSDCQNVGGAQAYPSPWDKKLGGQLPPLTPPPPPPGSRAPAKSFTLFRSLMPCRLHLPNAMVMPCAVVGEAGNHGLISEFLWISLGGKLPSCPHPRPTYGPLCAEGRETWCCLNFRAQTVSLSRNWGRNRHRWRHLSKHIDDESGREWQSKQPAKTHLPSP